MVHLEPHAFNIAVNGIHNLQVLWVSFFGVLLFVLQIECAGNSLRQLKYERNPVLPFLNSLISFEPEGQRFVVDEYKALKFPCHNLLRFAQVSFYALEWAYLAGGSADLLASLILHTVEETGLMSIDILDQQFCVEGLTPSDFTDVFLGEVLWITEAVVVLPFQLICSVIIHKIVDFRLHSLLLFQWTALEFDHFCVSFRLSGLRFFDKTGISSGAISVNTNIKIFTLWAIFLFLVTTLHLITIQFIT